MPIGTGRMTHLGLPNSELHVGIHFQHNDRVRAVSRTAALLFPGLEAVEPTAFRAAPPPVLVVLDGTWSQAHTLFRRNAFLHRLPRIAFSPRRPSEYQVRREPRPECWSTIEAVAHTLGQLESDFVRFAALLAPFRELVRTQLAYGPPAEIRSSTRRASAVRTTPT